MVVSVRVDHLARGLSVDVTVATVDVEVDCTVTVEVDERWEDPFASDPGYWDAGCDSDAFPAVGSVAAERAVAEPAVAEPAVAELAVAEPAVAEPVFAELSFLACATKSNQNGPGLIAKTIPE